KRFVTSSTFEAGIPRCLSVFDPAEESGKSSVYSEKHFLCCLGMYFPNALVSFFSLLQPDLLLDPGNGTLFFFPCFFSLGECSIVYPAAGLQPGKEFLLLLSVRVDAKPVITHCLGTGRTF